MEEFSRTLLIHKLKNLSLCRKKIRSISRWLLYHQDQYTLVVSTWFEEIMKAEVHKQLLFIYVADDVIQHNKEVHRLGYSYEFGKVLLATFKHMNNSGFDVKTMRALDIILNSWEKKGIYTIQKMQEFKRAINPTGISLRPEKRNPESLESSQDYGKKPHLDKDTESTHPQHQLDSYCRWTESQLQNEKHKMQKTEPVDKFTGDSNDSPKATY